MHFTKKVPEWHSEIVATPRPSLWVEQKHMILEHILLLPYMHDNRTVISVLKTDNPLLSGLYYHVGCSQYYMTMEWTHQSHSPMMERCCKLMHQMVYTVQVDCVAILASCLHGTSPSHGMTKHTSIQLDITCGCHEWWWVVIDLHKTSSGLEQAILYSSDFLRAWSCKLCNVEIEDQEHFLLHCTSLELFFGLKYPNTTLILSPRQYCQISIPTAPHGTHVYDCKGVHK